MNVKLLSKVTRILDSLGIPFYLYSVQISENDAIINSRHIKISVDFDDVSSLPDILIPINNMNWNIVNMNDNVIMFSNGSSVFYIHFNKDHKNTPVSDCIITINRERIYRCKKLIYY